MPSSYLMLFAHEESFEQLEHCSQSTCRFLWPVLDCVLMDRDMRRRFILPGPRMHERLYDSLFHRDREEVL